MQFQPDTCVSKQLLSNFETETVADTKQLEAKPKNGVAYKKNRVLLENIELRSFSSILFVTNQSGTNFNIIR